MKSLIVVFVVFLCGCSFQTGSFQKIESDKTDRVINLPIEKGRVWFRSFGHKRIGSVTTSYAVGSGGSASGITVNRWNVKETPEFVISIVRETDIFESVTPLNIGATPDFILEGSIKVEWEDPWWTTAQVIDLMIHAWIFPTLGRDLVATSEIRLYNNEYNLLYSWSVEYTKSYMGDIWWGMSHGGAYDQGADVEFQKEVMEYAFNEIKAELKSTTDVNIHRP